MERGSGRGNLSLILTCGVFVLIGLIVILQLKTVKGNKALKNENENIVIAQYKEKILELEESLEDKQKELSSNKEKYDTDLEALKLSNREFYELFKSYEENIEYYKVFACLTDVKGSGIDIGIDDANTANGALTGQTLVHDYYLVEVVNTLKAAGAQAISINGERVCAVTEMLCMGPSIRINNTRVFPPYHILAIGDPAFLKNSFTESNIYRLMLSNNLIVDHIEKKNVSIPKYSKNYASMLTSLFPISY